MPSVSVVITFLNADRFLATAIASVLSQSSSDWELLLVDDGSTDASGEIARRFASESPGRIRYLTHPGKVNLGMSASRNLGVANGLGEFIAFLDADDEWLPYKLEQQIRLARDYIQAGMICGTTEYWIDPEADPGTRTLVTPGVEPDRLYFPPALATQLYPLGQGAAPCPSDLLVRREIYIRIGGFEEHFKGDLQLYEDHAFLLKVYLTTPVFVSGVTWDRYRQHAGSCVATVKAAGKYREVRRYFLEWLIRSRDFASSNHDVKRVARRALFRVRYPRLAGLFAAARRLISRVDRRTAV